jgi:hypothetical protein
MTGELWGLMLEKIQQIDYEILRNDCNMYFCHEVLDICSFPCVVCLCVHAYSCVMGVYLNIYL